MKEARLSESEDDESDVFDTQAQCLLDAIEGAMAEGGAVISVCLGPPACELQGEDAVQNQEDGCPMCRRIFVHSDGTQEEYTEKAN